MQPLSPHDNEDMINDPGGATETRREVGLTTDESGESSDSHEPA